MLQMQSRDFSPWFGISATAPSPNPAVRRSPHCSKIYFLFQLRYFLPASPAAVLCAWPEHPCTPKNDLAGSHSAAIAGSRGSQVGDTVGFSLLGGQREQRRNQGWARSAAHPRAAVRAPEPLGKGKCWLGLCSSLGASLSPQGLWSTGTQLFPFPAGQGWLSRVLEHLRGVPRQWE